MSYTPVTGLYGERSNFKYTYYSIHLVITICFSDSFDRKIENDKRDNCCKPLPVLELKDLRQREIRKTGLFLTESERLSILDAV